MWHLRRVHASTMLQIFRERYIWSLRPISDEKLTSLKKKLIGHKSMASALFLALGLSPINDTLHFEKNDIDASQKNCDIKKKYHRDILKKSDRSILTSYFFSQLFIYFLITLQTFSRVSINTRTKFCKSSPDFQKSHLHRLRNRLQ